MDRRYGISTALSGKYCFTDRLEELKRDGIDYIELALEESFDTEKLLYSRLLPKIQNAGLKIWSVHLPFGKSVNPAQTNEKKRRSNIEKIKRFVDLTYNSGAEIYVIHGSSEPIEMKNRNDSLNASILSLNELNRFISQQNLTLALENLPRSCIGNSTAEIKKIMQILPDIRLCFDCNHFTTVKPNEHLLWLQRRYPTLRKKCNPQTDTAELYVSEFADKIATVHISDYDGINERHWLPGQGIINFRYIADVLEKSKFNAPVIFEPDSVCRGVVTTGKELISRYEAAISS